MSKSVEAFRTIAEVADDLAVPKHVLRFWEVKFPQIRPMKRGGGRRYYRPEDLELLRGIQALLHAEAYTIKGVQKILREQGVDHVKQFGREPLLVAGSKAAGKRKRAASEAAMPSRPGTQAAATADRGASQASGAAHARGTPTASGAAPARGSTGARGAAGGGVRQSLQAVLAELESCRSLLGGERQPRADHAATGRVRAGR